MAKSVTPRSVPAAKLINAQSGLCPSRSNALIAPPMRANAYADATCHKITWLFILLLLAKIETASGWWLQRQSAHPIANYSVNRDDDQQRAEHADDRRP